MTDEMLNSPETVEQFNKLVRGHKKELADALRAVVAVANKYPENYVETGQIGIVNQTAAVAAQLADQLDPPAAKE
jgi:hypothetical protein